MTDQSEPVLKKSPKSESGQNKLIEFSLEEKVIAPVISTINESRKSLNDTFDEEDLNSSMISYYNSGWVLKQDIQIDDAFEKSIMQEMQQRELKIKELQSDK